jgi:hypothetical protein
VEHEQYINKMQQENDSNIVFFPENLLDFRTRQYMNILKALHKSKNEIMCFAVVNVSYMQTCVHISAWAIAA